MSKNTSISVSEAAVAPPSGKSDSLRIRYLAKVATNFVGIATGMGVSMMVPRSLGPSDFGDYNFLLSYFQQLLPFITFSTTIGFFTKLSQRPREPGLISFYIQFTALACLLLLLFVVACQVFGLGGSLWAVKNLNLVYVASIYVVLNWVVSILLQMADAYGLTRFTEIAQIVQKLIGLVILGTLFLLHQLNLTNYFAYQIAITLALLVAAITIMNRSGYSFPQTWRLTRQELRIYCREFYEYSRPLFVYSLLGMALGVLERTLLQKYGGSAQQGFFGLAQSLGSVCSVFTAAMTALIMRDFSIAYQKQDTSEIRRLVSKYFPLLFTVSAYFGCFLSSQADKVSIIFGGKAFAGAGVSMMIFALYPIHQTYGQLAGSLFYATGKTKIYSILGMINMLIGFPLVYFALAPHDQFGFDGGATGLALKFVIAQFLGVNLLLFVMSRFLNLSFSFYLRHQCGVIGLLWTVGYLVSRLVDGVLLREMPAIAQFLVSGVIYTCCIGAIVAMFPHALGLDPALLKSAKAWLQKLRHKIL